MKNFNKQSVNNSNEKQQVYNFWNEVSCGEDLYLTGVDSKGFEIQSQRRCELELFILDFARFYEFKGKKVQFKLVEVFKIS